MLSLDMKLVKVSDKYDFYTDGEIFNIVPEGSPIPESGYYSAAYILGVKGFKHFRNADEEQAREYFNQDA